MQVKKLAIVAFSISSLFAPSVFAQEESATARQIIDKFQTDLIAVMKDGKKLGYAGRYKKLEPTVSNTLDLPKIARTVIGREGEKLTDEQQKKFSDIFSKFCIAEYAHNFSEFDGEEFITDSEVQMKNGGVVIYSRLILQDKKVYKFEYALKEKDSGVWRVINIINDGVSTLAIRRSDYTATLQREGFDALIAKINEKIDNYAKQ